METKARRHCAWHYSDGRADGASGWIQKVSGAGGVHESDMGEIKNGGLSLDVWLKNGVEGGAFI